MTLTTRPPATTTSEAAAPATDTAPASGRRGIVASWVAVGLGVAATGALAAAAIVAATRDDEPARVDTSRLVIVHGSVSAIDHRDQPRLTRRSPSETVAQHGSVSAIDHVDGGSVETSAVHGQALLELVDKMPAGWPATEAMRAQAEAEALLDLVDKMPAGWPATEAMRAEAEGQR